MSARRRDSKFIVKRTRIKICGITRPEDALHAVAAGADAIGLVFYEPSPRAVTTAQAVEICAQLPAFVTVVALTVNAEAETIQQVLESIPVGLLQFHGSETPQFCESFGRPYMKAIRMRPELDLSEEIERYSSAQSILLDAYQKGVPGGTGESFDWGLIPEKYRPQIILAGGLDSSNICSAVEAVRPYGVDVSGGVEALPGIKDRAKIAEFINNVQRADQAG